MKKFFANTWLVLAAIMLVMCWPENCCDVCGEVYNENANTGALLWINLGAAAVWVLIVYGIIGSDVKDDDKWVNPSKQVNDNE